MNKKPDEIFLLNLRHSVLHALDQASPDTLKMNEISTRTAIKSTSPEYDTLLAVIEQLIEEHLIYRSPRRRYGRLVPQIIVEGKLKKVRIGQWIVMPGKGDETTSLSIDLRHVWTAFEGDIVRAKMIGLPQPGEQPKGEVIKILTRSRTTLVGTLKRGRAMYLDPDEPAFHRTVTIMEKPGNAKVGDKVLVKLLDWDDPEHDPRGVVLKRIGRAGEFGAEVDSIAARFNLPHGFPKHVLAEAEAFAEGLSAEDLQGRRDLRDTVIFTIDPPDAHDFDDALSIDEHDDESVTLGIHIADVGHYVREGTALDEEARKRGTSVYLVTGVIPMLPERLSNNLCSLRPNEDRPAHSIFIRLSKRARIESYEIVKSVIRSCRRFTYDEALAVIESGKGDHARELQAIDKMARKLRDQRRAKGSVDFQTTELKFVLDESGQPVEVIQRRATRSTQLVEDCMLLANRVIAAHVGKTRRQGQEQSPFIYRIHDSPPKDKLLELATFVKSFGYTMPIDNVKPADIQKLVESARGTDEEDLINQVALRAMAKAVYSEHNIGHFGLAFDYYTHFTSPIRRYPGLIVHRMLSEYRDGMSAPRRQHYAGALGELADHCSLRERAAVEAERASVKIAEVKFLKKHIGGTFDAVIAGIMPFGMFAELKEFGIEGLIRMRDRYRDREQYVYEESSKSFRSTSSRRRYRMGDSVRVRIARVDEMSSQIDLELLSGEK